MSDYIPYSERLKDPRWQKKRLEVLQYADWRCQLCGDAKSTLHCHHSYYEKGKMPWDYPTGSIISLCEKCHGNTHRNDICGTEFSILIENISTAKGHLDWFVSEFSKELELISKNIKTTQNRVNGNE